MPAYGFSGGWHNNNYEAWIGLLGMGSEPFTRISEGSIDRDAESGRDKGFVLSRLSLATSR